MENKAQGTFFTTPTINSLKEFWIYPLHDGTPVFVLSEKVSYFLYKIAPLPSADGINVVAANNGAGVWIRMQVVPFSPSTYSNQPVWYIDPVNGNDNAVGDTPSTAIKTMTQLGYRLSGVPIYIAMTWNIMNNVPSTDAPAITIVVASGGSLTVAGIGATTLRSSNFTSRTLIAPATNVPASQADTSLATNNGFATYIARGNRFRIPSGANAGACTWGVLDQPGSAAKTFRSGPWIIPNPAISTLSLAQTSIAATDPYIVEQLTSIDNIRFMVRAFSPQTFIPNVVFKDLTFTNQSSIISDVGGGSCAVGFYGCDVGMMNVIGDVTYVNCTCGDRGAFFYQVANTARIFTLGGVNVANGVSVLGTFTADLGFLVQSKRISVNAGYTLLANCAVFDSPTNPGVQILSGNDTVLQANFGSFALYGSGNGTYGLRVRDGAGFSAPTFTGATITGATNDVLVGATAKTWSQMPFIDQDFSGSSTKIASGTLQT